MRNLRRSGLALGLLLATLACTGPPVRDEADRITVWLQTGINPTVARNLILELEVRNPRGQLAGEIRQEITAGSTLKTLVGQITQGLEKELHLEVEVFAGEEPARGPVEIALRGGYRFGTVRRLPIGAGYRDPEGSLLLINRGSVH